MLIMKCPECRKEMEKDYIRTTAIIWKKRNSWLEPSEFLLGKRLWGSSYEAYRCPNCKIVIIPYGEKKEKTEKG